MSALTKHEARNDAAADPFLGMIAQHADKPDVLDKLIAIRNSEIDRRAKVAFWADFALMQPKLPTIDRKGRIEIRKKDKQTGERDGDVQQSSAYALWADIMAACKPAMLEHGFGITFRQEPQPDGKIVVIGMLAHRDGHIEENRSIPLQHESTGNKNWHQAIGSTLSYGMRYCGIMLLGISSRENDDDKGGAEPATITDEQVVELQTMMSNVGANTAKFCEYLKVAAIPDLRADQFGVAMSALRQKAQQKVPA